MLTLITEDSTPVRLANALPSTTIAITMLASWIHHAVGAEWTFPPRTAPERETQS